MKRPRDPARAAPRANNGGAPGRLPAIAAPQPAAVPSQSVADFIANPSGSTPERLPPLVPQAPPSADLSQLLHAMSMLQETVQAQQRQTSELVYQVRAGVQDELSGLWSALRERDERRDAWMEEHMHHHEHEHEHHQLQVEHAPNVAPRDLKSLSRAERAEAALAVKEAECENLRARLRELEGYNLRSQPDGRFAAPPPRGGARDAQAATRVQAHVRGRHARATTRTDVARAANRQHIHGTPFKEDLLYSEAAQSAVAAAAPTVPASDAVIAAQESRSATRVQAHVRGRQARAVPRAAMRGVPYPDETILEEPPYADTSLSDRERERAATRVQARARGRASRQTINNAWGEIDSYAEAEKVAEAAVEELEAAAAMVSVEELEAGEVGDELQQSAATRVQARERGRRARGRGKVSMLPSPDDEPPTASPQPAADDAHWSDTAATRVQANVRGRQVRARARTRCGVPGIESQPEALAEDQSGLVGELVEVGNLDELEAEQRTADADADARQREVAAARVQAQVRGRAARSALGAVGAAEVQAAAAVAGEDGVLVVDTDEGAPEELAPEDVEELAEATGDRF